MPAWFGEEFGKETAAEDTRSFVLLATVLAARPAHGQRLAPPTASQPPAANSQAQDSLGRDTPRGCVVGFLRAVERGAYSQAVDYLELRTQPDQAETLARQLGVVLDRGLLLALDSLSRSPEGGLNDGLPPNRERIGSVQTTSGNLEIVLDRVTPGNKPPIWLFSADTLRKVPRAFEDLQNTGIARFVPRALTTKLFSIPLWRWLLEFLSIPLAWISASFLSRLLRPVLHFAVRPIAGQVADRHSRLLTRPIRVLLLALAGLGASIWAGSVLERAFWAGVSVILAVAGVSWLLIAAANIVSELQSQRLTRIAATEQVAVLALGRRLFTVIVFLAAALFLIHRAGFSVSALLAGLGIGGIALALAAQKTLEDLLGGVAIISRHAARVGDYCQVAGATGTIEDIGLSSTRIRTPDRTVITLPNGKISQMNLENFSLRDKFWFHHVFGLRYETPPQILRSVLDEVNRMLREDPRVESETARLRFVGWGPSSLNMEIYAYIRQTAFDEFLVVQEELMLRIMDIIGGSGTALALPSQIMVLDRDSLARIEKDEPPEDRPKRLDRTFAAGRAVVEEGEVSPCPERR